MSAYVKEPLFDDLARNARKGFVPLSGFFELTPRCTLDCKMCYVHLTDEQMRGKKELPTEQWIQIIDEAIECGMLFAVLTGGECMMHYGFRDIYLHLREKGIVTMINTNATLFNDSNLDFIIKNPPNKIKITLYGTSEDGYERVTGHRQFNRVKNTIIKLKELGMNLKLAITICKYSYDETIEILEFARKHKIPYMLDMAMCQAEDDTGRNLDDYALTAEEVAKKYLEILIHDGKQPTVREPITELPKRLDDGRTACGLRCGAGRSSFTIKWDGRLQPCMWVGDNAPNVLELGFEKSWEIANRTVVEHLIPVECVECQYAKACFPCPMIRTNPNDPGHCNPKTCEVTIAKINAGIFSENFFEKENC